MMMICSKIYDNNNYFRNFINTIILEIDNQYFMNLIVIWLFC